MEEIRKRGLHLIIILSVMILAVFAFFKIAEADANAAIGSVNGTQYNSYEDLSKRVADSDGQTITIDMMANWDSHDLKEYIDRLFIPSDCNATLNMHGYMFNRGLAAGDAYTPCGELIYLKPGSSLTINGYTEKDEMLREHDNVPAFASCDQEKATWNLFSYGGTLAGGNTIDGGGCIDANNGKDIILNDVTIIGCKSSDFINPTLHCGYGGAILITEDGTKLKMKNSIIEGCLAEQDGGAIYAADDDNIEIKLERSRIDSNYANSDGGGINLDGEDVSITGDNESLICRNQTNGYGGGVYFWNDKATLKKVVLEANVAEGKGGGVYVEETGTLLDNVQIDNNAAPLGGGVYIKKGDNTINSCNITENSRYGVYVESGCKAGVNIHGSTVVKDNRGDDFSDAVNLAIADQTSYLNFNVSDGMDVHVGYVKNPTSEDGYEITNGPTLDYSDRLTADDSNYEIVYSYRDKNQDDGRRLRYIKKTDQRDDRGRKRKKPEIETVKTQDAHAYTESDKVYAGGYTEDEGGSGTKYEMRKVYAHHGSNNFLTYYSDGFFYDDPVIYNDHIATASYSLASAGCYLWSYDYPYKHAAARQFMADIGCPDQMIYVNDSNTTVPGTDSIGVTIGSKHLQKCNSSSPEDTGDVLIAIAVRGANYEKEWASNVTLGDGSDTEGGEAKGFSEAADQVMEAVDYYIARYGLQDKIKQGKVKFWVSGFSRAGATSNITSKRLLEKYCYDKTEQEPTGNCVFAYPLEAPKGGTDVAEKLDDKTKYYCIHNLINTGDPVPLVAPLEMGFKRYGVDHYMPGTYLGIIRNRDDYLHLVKTETKTDIPGASAASGIRSVTTYSDNEWLDTKKNKSSVETASYKEYDTRRDNMIRHLAAIDHNVLFTDYFYPYGTDVWWPPYQKLGKFDGATVEDYLPNFMAFVQQEAFDHTDYRVKYSDRLQALARDFMAADSDKEGKKKLEAIKKGIEKMIKSGDITTYEWLFAIFGDYNEYTPETQKQFINRLWNVADEEGAFSELSAEEYKVVHGYWFQIADAFFNFTDGDWDLGITSSQGSPVFPAGPNWVNGTFGDSAGNKKSSKKSSSNSLLENKLIYSLTVYLNSGMMVDTNHTREIGGAWTRTYDSYFSKDTSTGEMKDGTYTEYKVDWVYSSNPDDYAVEKPGAYIKDSVPNAPKPYKDLKETTAGQEPQYNEVDADQRILFEVGKVNDGVSPADEKQGAGDVIGEAIYYRIYNVSGGKETGLNPPGGEYLYRGGVDLPVGEDGKGQFKIVARARSLGQKSKEAVYYIGVGHKVTVDDGSEKSVCYYSSGDKVTAAARPGDEQFFTNWMVRLLDKDGEPVEDDIAEAILNGKQKDVKVSFEMPKEGDEYAEGKKYPYGYELEITAVCKNRITDITPSSAQGGSSIVPVAGNDNRIAGSCDLAFKNGGDPWDSPDNPYKITWKYKYNNKDYAASADEPIYGNCVYTATIIAPKNEAEAIAFASEISVSASPEMEGKYTSATAKRDDSDGSAVITIVFNKTGDGPQPPEANILLRFRGIDAGDPQTPTTELGDYGYVRQNMTLELGAKNWDGYKFDEWVFGEEYDKYIEPADAQQDLKDRVIRIRIKNEIPTTHDTLCLYAKYKPVISEMKSVVKVPEGGKAMQMDTSDDADKETLKIKLQGDWYVVHPDYINTVNDKGSIAWSPEPMISSDVRKAAYLTSYTANLRIIPKKDGEVSSIMVRKEGEESYKRINADLLYAENVTATMNGKAASFDTDSSTLGYTFPMTKYTLKKVYQPEDVTGIPYGTEGEELRTYLPLIKIQVDNGRTMETTAAWGDLKKNLDSLDEYSMHIWTADGVTELPYGVENPDEISLDVFGKLFVDAAKSVEKAVPSVEPGKYLYDQRLTLSSETEGATIYWTKNPEATDDIKHVKDDPKWTIYEGLMIPINRKDAEDEIGADGEPTGRKIIRLRTAAFKDGMRPDGVRTYTYVFGNEVDVPKGHERQYTGGPQIGVSGGKFYTLEPESEGVTIDEEGDAVATETGKYKVRAKINDGFRWEIKDPETGRISYTTKDQIIPFSIKDAPAKKYTVTYDLKGGKLDGKTGKIKKTYVEDTVVKLPEPTKKGYSFKYWKGTKNKIVRTYKAGTKYKVTGDVTFTACWKMLYSKPIAVMKAKGKNKLVISWTKVDHAAGYDIFFTRCNTRSKSYKLRGFASVWKKGIRSIEIKGLKKGRVYKACVKAYIKKNGKKKYVSKSPVVHAYAGGRNSKHCNPKNVKVRKKAVTLKKGRTSKIRAHVRKLRKDRKLISSKHTNKLRYLSTNKTIATVSRSGKIRAKAAGSCKIYVLAANGVHKIVKVKVKK